MRPYVNARAAVNGIGCMLEWRGPHTYLRPRTSPGASPSLPSGGPTTWSSWYCGCGEHKVGASKYQQQRPVPGRRKKPQPPLRHKLPTKKDEPRPYSSCAACPHAQEVTGVINKHLIRWASFSCHFHRVHG